MNTTQLCAKLISITALTALLAACGGSDSSSESSDSLSDSQTRVAEDITNVDTDHCYIIDVQFTPRNGTISNSKDSLRATVVFEYPGELSAEQLSPNIFMSDEFNAIGSDTIGSNSVNSSNIEVRNGKVTAFLSFPLRRYGFIGKSNDFAFVTLSGPGSFPDQILCSARKPIDFTFVE